MTIVYEERPSDSPYVETIIQGRTVSAGSTIRPAAINWHMVFVKLSGRVLPLVVGPLTMSGVASWGAGAEILWIRFKLGTFMPHLPARNFLDIETILPEAASKSFWLKGSAWQFPDYENVDTFLRLDSKPHPSNRTRAAGGGTAATGGIHSRHGSRRWLFRSTPPDSISQTVGGAYTRPDHSDEQTRLPVCTRHHPGVGL